ncbi:C39 family peptidase [Persephonella sp.]
MKKVIFLLLLLVKSGLCGTVYIINQDVSIKRKIKSYIEFKNEGLIRQEFDYSCGSSSLATILKFFFNDEITEKEVLDWVLDKKGLIDKDCKDGKEEKCKIKKLEELEEDDFKLSFFDLAEFAKEKGYKAVALALNLDELRKLKVPAIAFVKIRRNEHFTVYRGMDKKFVYLADPSFGNIKVRIGKFKEMFYTRNDPEYRGKILVFIPRDKKIPLNFKFLKLPDSSEFMYKVIRIKSIY